MNHVTVSVSGDGTVNNLSNYYCDHNGEYTLTKYNQDNNTNYSRFESFYVGVYESSKEILIDIEDILDQSNTSYYQLKNYSNEVCIYPIMDSNNLNDITLFNNSGSVVFPNDLYKMFDGSVNSYCEIDLTNDSNFILTVTKSNNYEGSMNYTVINSMKFYIPSSDYEFNIIVLYGID